MSENRMHSVWQYSKRRVGESPWKGPTRSMSGFIVQLLGVPALAGIRGEPHGPCVNLDSADGIGSECSSSSVAFFRRKVIRQNEVRNESMAADDEYYESGGS